MLRNALRHLRLYESGQILVPGLFGVLTQRGSSASSPLVLYFVAYGTHLLSVYSYNDYCDLDTDALNPRKAPEGGKSPQWFRNQTLALTGIFLVSASLLPRWVGLLLLANQALCMAYSAPGVRLKGRLLGSELAHFFAGFTYLTTGVLVAGGSMQSHWMAALLFGALYLSGGTFNEIMDRESDEAAGMRHLAVRMGGRRALLLVVSVHGLAFALLVAYQPSAGMAVVTLVAVAVYVAAVRRVLREPFSPERLLEFRRRYRLVFAILLLVLGGARVAHAYRLASAGEIGAGH
jgi:4-hydroxybenzoate polyprenyltransferase